MSLKTVNEHLDPELLTTTKTPSHTENLTGSQGDPNTPRLRSWMPAEPSG